MHLSAPGMADLLTFASLWALVLGTFVGMIIGAIPGMGTMIAIVLLLPLTYYMDPLPSILLLLSAYQSSEYGGSISAIILGIPGVPASAATVLDGNTLARTKSPGKALGYSLFACLFGGLVGGLALIFLSVPLTKFALRISDPEVFLLCLIGLTAVSLLTTNNKLNSMISVLLGLIASTVGLDLLTGRGRFVFGRTELMDGLNIIALVVGLYAFPELFSMISDGVKKRRDFDARNLKTYLRPREVAMVFKPMAIGSVIGAVVGMIPGLGANIASWVSYAAAKKTSRHPETFGTGNPEGIAAPEAANNASVGGGLVPLLSLGIPGTPAAAVVMGAFIIHGIQPGPHVLSSDPGLVFGIFYGFLATAVIMYVVGLLVSSLFTRVLVVPSATLVPIILLLSIVGVYASRQVFFDLWISLAIGVAVFVLVKLEFSPAAIIVAFVLGPIMETSLRRTLVLSHGSYSVFFTRSYSIVLLLVLAGIVAAGIWSLLATRRSGREALPSTPPAP